MQYNESTNKLKKGKVWLKTSIKSYAGFVSVFKFIELHFSFCCCKQYKLIFFPQTSVKSKH